MTFTKIIKIYKLKIIISWQKLLSFFYIFICQRDIMSPDYVYILYCTNMSREDWNITNSLETFHILTY